MHQFKSLAEKYQDTIFESSNTGMLILDLDSYISEANERFCKITGYDKTELLNCQFSSIFHKANSLFDQKKSNLLKKEESSGEQLEQKCLHKKGHLITLTLKLTPLHNVNGIVESLLIQVIDTTESKNSFSANHQNDKYFKLIFEKAPIGMAIADQNLSLIRVNEALCNLTQYTEDELLQLSIIDITHPDDLETNLQKDADIITGNQDSYLIEKRYVRKDGSIIDGMLKVNPIRDEKGNIEHLVGQVVNVSQLKAYEKLLESNIDQLLKVNHEIDQFVYHASHDLKGPLASMQGLLALFNSGVKPDEVFERMKHPIGKMEKVIEALSEFSENNHEKDKESTIELKSFFGAIIKKIEKEAQQKSIHIILRLPDEIIRINPNGLAIIIKHLLKNAIQYHDKKEGTVNLTVEMKENILNVKIEDDGPGIDDIVKDHIFEMFYRGHEKSEGSGMGLYLVKKAIEKMRGTIDWVTKEKVGTKFCVKLPLATA